MTMTVAARAIATARSVVRASRLRNVFTAQKSQSHALLIRQVIALLLPLFFIGYLSF